MSRVSPALTVKPRRSLSGFASNLCAGWFGSWIRTFALSDGLIPGMRNRPSRSVTASRKWKIGSEG